MVKKRTEPEDMHDCAAANRQFVTTMSWTSDGKILLMGLHDGCEVYDDYGLAEQRFLQSCQEIVDGKPISIDPHIEAIYTDAAKHMHINSMTALRNLWPDKALKFAEGGMLSLQFVKMGDKAYVLHNSERYQFMSETSSLKTLVPELFFQKSAQIGQMRKSLVGKKDEPFFDPEIERMLREEIQESPSPHGR